MSEQCKKCLHYDGTYCYIGNEIFLVYSRDVEHCESFEEQINHSYKASDIDKEVDKLNRLLIVENKSLKEEIKQLKNENQELKKRIESIKDFIWNTFYGEEDK